MTDKPTGPLTAELEKLREWLLGRAEQLNAQAEGRKQMAASSRCEVSPKDRRIAHKLAEQMMGRRLPKTTAAEEKRSAEIDEKIAAKYEDEARQLTEWAALLASRQSDRPATELTEAQVCKALGDAPALLASLDTEAITAALNAELRTAVLPPDGLREALENREREWDDKAEAAYEAFSKSCSADYTYGYYRGISEGFRCASTIAATPAPEIEFRVDPTMPPNEFELHSGTSSVRAVNVGSATPAEKPQPQGEIMPFEAIYKQDEGGNSVLTRLQAEVEFNKSRAGNLPVTDSSLTHADLRKILDAFLNPKPAEGPETPVDALTFTEFSRANRTRCESPNGFNHALSSWSASDWVTATTGELGEMANIVKKLNRVRDGIPGNDKTPEELKVMFADELADTFCYLDLLAQSQGINLEEAVVKKFNEVSKRRGYSAALRGTPSEGK